MSFTQFLSILRARWKVSVALLLAFVVVSVALALLLPKGYVATASVVIEGKADPLSAVLYPGGVNPNLIATQVDVINSDRVAYQVVKNLKLADNPTIRQQWRDSTNGEGSIEQWLSGVFQKSLEVRPSRESSVISISYQAPDPRFAAALANAFVTAYLEVSLGMRVEPARQYSSFFEARAAEGRAAVEAAQARLSAFQKKSEIVASDERLDVENTRLNELSSQLVALQALAAESSSRTTQANGSSADRTQEVLGNPLISGLKSDLARTEVRLEELSARYGENYPQVQEAKSNIAELKKKVAAETARVTGGVAIGNTINRQREADVRNALEAQRAKLLKLKASRDEIAVLVRDVDVAQRTYDQIQQRLNQASLESQATQSNVTVLTQAEAPVRASYPRRFLITLVGGFLGLLAAVAVALIREAFDRRVRSAEDVVLAVALPLLGILPGPKAKRLLGRDGSKAKLLQMRLLSPASPNAKGG